ncbi:MAG: asparagine synthase (glutamine-hydrolyzing) [Flavobacteriales bacterium]|nr:asparagine synthase (glutamine-hydrolyzing) [Flavobacteriales bacterium]
MCGIVGQIFFDGRVLADHDAMQKSLHLLSKRGPDYQNDIVSGNAHLGHARLSIIDVSDHSNQPFEDESGRYSLVFNGEIFNYVELRDELISQGEVFKSSGDTEVLQRLLIRDGSSAINKLNGFFAFCFHDKVEQKSIIARDRYGIKPLVYYSDKGCITFASEIKALNPLIGKREIDKQSLRYFFQFNYISAPYTILKDVYKLEPGTLLEVSSQGVSKKRYYEINASPLSMDDYHTAKKKVYNLLHEATERRLIADVPVGAFLSGGIDSSVVSLIASKYTSSLKTFSIGFKDNPYFDETAYAELVANKIKSEHTVLKLSNDDLLGAFEDAMNYLDEPFADSSSLNMFILSQHTRRQVTVALSGDGADELFSGYNKHQALLNADKQGLKNTLVRVAGSAVAKMLPKTRDSKIGNVGRQLDKFSSGLKLSAQERYIQWASFMSEDVANVLVDERFSFRPGFEYLSKSVKSFNDYLERDFKMVLEGDMLRKVDAMSMANSLEVRTPFLDVNLVDYVFSLPAEYKIQGGVRKKILREAFQEELPEQIFNRGKKGFEVPLKQWFENELRSKLSEWVFNRDMIKAQEIFDWEQLSGIEQKLHSDNSGDSIYNVWAMLSFQIWYLNYKKQFN